MHITRIQINTKSRLICKVVFSCRMCFLLTDNETDLKTEAQLVGVEFWSFTLRTVLFVCLKFDQAML